MPDQEKVDRMYDRNPIMTSEALAILRQKADELPRGKLFFPKWSSQVASRVIKAVAAEEGWEEEAQWCAYSARHGASTDAFAEGLETAMSRGNWTTAASAIRYGATTRVEPERPAEHRALMIRQSAGYRARARLRLHQRRRRYPLAAR